MIILIAKEKKISFLFVVVIFFTFSCSRQLYPESSFQNIKGQTEGEKMKNFLDQGTGKQVITGNLSPDQIIHTAEKFIGVPYCMGGTNMKCVDCSGLLVAVFAQHGITLPHNSEEQARYGIIIPQKEKLKRGDLLFFIRSYQTKNFITHAGIYLGDEKFIHTSSKKGVTISSLNDSWWRDKFIFGTRILASN